MRGYRLVGAEAGGFLDRILVECDVLGVCEQDAEIEVWVSDESSLPSDHSCVAVTEIEVREDECRTGFEDDKPILLDEDLMIRPPWVPRPEEFVGLELVVPRGRAFGSGEHESTQLALRALRTEVSGGSLADVGTGTGILALLAQEMGCAPIFACDIDLHAVRASADLVARASVILGGADALSEPVDHVIANMTADELRACLPDLLRIWNGSGQFILSGVRRSEEAEFLTGLPCLPTSTLYGREFLVLAWDGSLGADLSIRLDS